MKRRILAILLTVFLLAGLLPAVALADDTGYVNSYDDLVARVKAGYEAYIYDPANFQWPDEEVTLTVTNTISAGGDWTIPSNVTLNLEKGSSGKYGSIQMNSYFYDRTLTVEGTINAVDGNILDARNVVLKKGGVITSTGEIYVGINNIWSLEAGAVLDASLRLDGTLKGNGSTVNGNIKVWAGYMSTDSDVVFSGELTLTGNITVQTSTYTDEDPVGPFNTKITVAENSTITVDGYIILGDNVDIEKMNAERPDYTYHANYPTMQIDGELIVNKPIGVADESKITLGDKGVLNLQPGTKLNFAENAEDEVKTFVVVNGTGTIKVCVTREIGYTSVFEYYPLWGDDMSECPNIADTVNVVLWRSWIDCDHVWSEWEVTEEATCGEEGAKSRTCTVCGTTETETIPATGEHVWGEGVVTTEPTCTEAGVMTYTCTVCGETETEEIPATGHTPDDNKDCEKATYCKVCGAVLKEAGEHTWDDGEVTREQNCGEKGEKTYTCTVCGATKTEDIDPTGNHTWNDGVITTEPTCTKEGVKTYTCTVCGETKTEVVPTIEHTPDGNTDCEKATLCKVCGAVLKEAGEHTWDDGEVTTEPTCTEEGEILYNCKNCDATKTETVEALGHDLEYSAEGAVITESCTRGDHEATATVTAVDAVYTGEAIKTAQVVTSDGWLGGEVTVTYENNVNAGTATANITVEGVTATVNFEIAKATATITLGNLSQYTNNLGAVTATVEPKDETAVIVVEYGTEVAGTPCTHEHTEECGGTDETCTHEHDEECGFAEASTVWSETAPTTAGTYKVRARVESSDNLVVSEETSYTEGTLEIRRYVYVDPDPTPVTPSKPTTPATPEPEPVNAAEVYNDVEETDWYIESVNYVVENGLMNGYDEETFAPNDNLSRAMLMTIIARIDGVDTESGENWYEAGMAWAVENGITDGSNPLANITREQLVTMLYRYIGSPEVSGELNFKDVSEISGYAVDAMTWAVQNGILKGTDVGTLNPQNSATRAEAAAILARFCESVKK